MAGLVMKTALEDFDTVRRRPVDKPVFFINPPRPIAGKIALKRLWFTNTRKRRALAFFNKPINAFDDLLIGFLPVKIIRPRIRIELNIHGSMRSFSINSPFFERSNAFRRRDAFFGEDNK